MKFLGKFILVITAIILMIILIFIILIGFYSLQNSKLPVLSPVIIQYNESEPEPISTEIKTYLIDSFAISNSIRQAANESLIQANADFAVSQSSEYLCPDSSGLRITAEYPLTAISPLDDYTVYQMAAWELLAKHGYVFQDSTIQNYFDSKKWYEIIPAKSENFDIIYLRLTDLEQENYTFFLNQTS